MGILSRPEFQWPLPNVWLGVSVEDQATADERIPLLLRTPAALRFVSYEPALGPVNLLRYMSVPLAEIDNPGAMLDWVIVGGESGPGARPMHPKWLRDVRDQCQITGVPFFFNQWGEYSPDGKTQPGDRYPDSSLLMTVDGPARSVGVAASDVWMHRVGKKSAGALLDGREWREFPKVQTTVSEVCA